MGIVLFAVCTVFGVVAVVLWAALSTARAKLAQSKQLALRMLAIIEDEQTLSAGERTALADSVAELYGDHR